MIDLACGHAIDLAWCPDCTSHRDGQMSWRVIDEAPKDGTPILAWVPAYDFTPASAHRVVFAADTWWLIGLGTMKEFGSRIQPTHWMPLPSSPGLNPQA